MSEPTRQEILDAHSALVRMGVSLKAGVKTNEHSIRCLQDVILKALPPRPLPTMAEVEWDDDEHYLAEACHEDYGKVVMLGPCEQGLIDILLPPYQAKRSLAVERETLTLTGKRYMLTEVQE